HHLPVGFAGGGEFLVAFFEGVPQVEDLVARLLHLSPEDGGAARGTEPGALADLGAEQFGEPVFATTEARSPGVAACGFRDCGVPPGPVRCCPCDGPPGSPWPRTYR